jgi:hypothetical protein
VYSTVSGLTPGKRYAVTVSAVNERGQGQRAVATPALMITPPLTVPSPPTGVTVAVKTWGVTASPNDLLGDSQRLIVTYAPPLSNGGTAVTAYRVELDPTPTFDNPIVEDFDCPSRPDYATWVVKTAATVGGDSIDSGYFTLQLQHNGQTRVTNAIPFNAVALAVQESHAPTFVNDIQYSPVTCVQDATATAGLCPVPPGGREAISGSMQMRLNMLGILGDGVDVSVQQYDPADANAYAWTITFLDKGDDFTLSLASGAGMVAAGGGGVTVSVAHVGVGDAHSPCTGSMVVPSMATPSGSALVQGELYYARVTAYNRIGYSDSQAAAAPIKPAMVPGRPTSVTVNKYDATSLKVRTTYCYYTAAITITTSIVLPRSHPINALTYYCLYQSLTLLLLL